MAIETAVITGTSPTSIGTKSFEFAGFGTPQAVIIFVSEANTTNNPESDGGICIGFTDGTNQGLAVTVMEDGVATTNTNRRYRNTKVAYLLSPGGGNKLIANFNAWATDGITLDFTIVDSVAHHLSIMLIKGCADAYVGNVSMGTTATIDITAPGFKPNLVLAACTGTPNTSVAAQAVISFGAAHNNSSDMITQGQIALSSRDALSTETGYVVTRDDSFVGQMNIGVQNWKGVAESFDASGFSINPDASAGSDDLVYLALDTGDTDGVSVDIVNSPTSTGTWSITAPGFTPQSTILAMASGPVTNTILDADPISFALSMFDGTTEACIGVDIDDAATTTDIQSNQAAKAIQTYEFGGSTHDLMHEATFNSFDANGYSLSFPTYVDGTARKWLSIAISSGAAPSVANPWYYYAQH